jgi:N utilization substance protein B
MGTRRRSRELAMQALFCLDSSQDDFSEQLALFCRCFPPPRKARRFFFNLVHGVTLARKNIDHIIERFSNNWKISRMSGVDRNVLRLAVFEMLYCQDIPAKVSINEAIDVGKKFGTDESGAFINGILDSVRIAIEQFEIKADPDIQQTIEKELAAMAEEGSPEQADPSANHLVS